MNNHGSFAKMKFNRMLVVGTVTMAVNCVVMLSRFVMARHGRELFPWLIARDDGRAIDFTVRLTELSLSAAVGRIAEYLNGHGVFGAVVVRDGDRAAICRSLSGGPCVASELKTAAKAPRFLL